MIHLSLHRRVLSSFRLRRPASYFIQQSCSFLLDFLQFIFSEELISNWGVLSLWSLCIHNLICCISCISYISSSAIPGITSTTRQMKHHGRIRHVPQLFEAFPICWVFSLHTPPLCPWVWPRPPVDSGWTLVKLAQQDSRVGTQRIRWYRNDATPHKK